MIYFVVEVYTEGKKTARYYSNEQRALAIAMHLRSRGMNAEIVGWTFIP